MSVVVTFERFRPPPRYDNLPWTEARIEEAATATGTFTQIDVYTIAPVDPDPTDPAYQSFTTELGTDENQWYRIVFADGTGDVSVPTIPIQNEADAAVINVEPYATTSELATILQVNETSNHDALARVLLAAAGEIVTECGRSDFAGWELQLVAQVNLARAEELWRQMKVPWGIVMDTSGVGGATYIAKDTFARHAAVLSPLKVDWGIA
jgi:hypothetical protein